MCWEDVFDNGVRPSLDTVIEVWEGGELETIKKIVSEGYQSVMAAFWYLDDLSKNWGAFYVWDIDYANLTAAEKKLVMGGETCMWGESVDATNIIPRIFPRGTGIGEVLWSSPKLTKLPALSGDRLSHWRCRMLIRGHSVEPVPTFFHQQGDSNGRDYCSPL